MFHLKVPEDVLMFHLNHLFPDLFLKIHLEPEVPIEPLEPDVPDEPLVPELPSVPFEPDVPLVPDEPLVPE
jgi:hypothetical protein